jgi:ankyrin repeat protein
MRDIDKALIAACERGDIDAVKAALAAGADINAEGQVPLFIDGKIIEDSNGIIYYTEEGAPLLLAAQLGHDHIARFLIEEGAKVIVDRWSLFSIYLHRGNEEMFRLLFEHYGDLRCDRGQALEYAAMSGLQDLVKSLIVRGANPRADKSAALHLLVLYGDTEAVKLLIDLGADVTAEDNLALYEAANFGYADIVALLIEHGADVNAREGAIIVNTAAHEHIEALKALLQTNLVTQENINRGLYSGAVKAISLLLEEYSADINTKIYGEYKTPLSTAILSSNYEVVSFLLESGADPNIIMPDDCDPTLPDDYSLVYAMNTGKQQLGELLLRHGADPNIRNGYALCLAVSQGYERMVRLLLEKGADIELANRANDRDNIEWAKHFEYTQIALLLRIHRYELPESSNTHSEEEYIPVYLAANMEYDSN